MTPEPNSNPNAGGGSDDDRTADDPEAGSDDDQQPDPEPNGADHVPDERPTEFGDSAGRDAEGGFSSDESVGGSEGNGGRGGDGDDQGGGSDRDDRGEGADRTDATTETSGDDETDAEDGPDARRSAPRVPTEPADDRSPPGERVGTGASNRSVDREPSSHSNTTGGPRQGPDPVSGYTRANHLHPLSAVTISLRTGLLGFSLPFLLIGVLSGILELVPIEWSIYLAPVGLVVGVAYGIAYYYRFEYELTENTFDVASGVLSRRDREIPYGRIQNVDVRQGVIHRVLDLAVLSIETAGGGATEAQLNFVSEDEAKRLQREIRRRTRTADDRRRSRRERESVRDDVTDSHPAGLATDETASGDAFTGDDEDPVVGAEDAGYRDQKLLEDDSPRLLFDLKAKELLLYSLTTIRAAAIAGVLAIVFFFTDTVINLLVTTAQPFGGPEDLTTGTSTSYLVLGVVSAINGAVVTYVVSVAYTFATYYDFRLGRADDDFVYERGLLQRYSGSIPSEKVQSVTVTDNPVQRAISYGGLWVETAGYGPDSSSGSTSAVPLAENRRVHQFAENLTGVETPLFESPPPLARRRYLARYSILATALVVAAFGVSTLVGFTYWYLTALVYLAVPPAAHLRYVNLGYYVGEDHLVIRRGFWRRRTTVIPYYRIQTISNRRSIFQRRLGLTSVVVDTASSQTFIWATPTIYDVYLEDGREVAHASRRRLQSALAERRRDDESGPTFSVDFT